MAIKAVVKMGNAGLATPSLAVANFADEPLLEIVQNMRDTMAQKGGVGIAAPQIGVNKRIILFGFDSNERYPKESAVPLTILVNPSFKPLANDMTEGWEGCLSVPGLRGLVPRYQHIQYQGSDLAGELIIRVAEGFHARVFQHEYDHLDGILYPERIKDLKFFGFEDELQNVIWPKTASKL